jgi:uncharacterized protein
MIRTVAWAKDDPFGVEHAEITLANDTLHATSVAIGTYPEPYRVDLELLTGPNWTTASLAIRTRGDGWNATLNLGRVPSGSWSAQRTANGIIPGLNEYLDAVAIPASVVDVDVQYSPLTNLMPARRLGLNNVGATADFTMAWVALPGLHIILDRQRYTIVDQRQDQTIVRYRSIDGDFSADITCDADGIAIDYPGIAHRLG